MRNTFLEIDPPTAVDRILGRKHVYYHSEGKTTIFYDMVDVCRSSCSLYVELSQRVLKEASTPFVPDGAIVNAHWDEKGALSTSASRVLMNFLWCARLARPNLIKPINVLTRKVSCWSLAGDKMCCLCTTPHLSLKSWIADPFESLSINLYTDADHESETEHAKSTSGMVLVLQGPNSFFPLTQCH